MIQLIIFVLPFLCLLSISFFQIVSLVCYICENEEVFITSPCCTADFHPHCFNQYKRKGFTKCPHCQKPFQLPPQMNGTLRTPLGDRRNGGDGDDSGSNGGGGGVGVGGAVGAAAGGGGGGGGGGNGNGGSRLPSPYYELFWACMRPLLLPPQSPSFDDGDEEEDFEEEESEESEEPEESEESEDSEESEESEDDQGGNENSVTFFSFFSTTFTKK